METIDLQRGEVLSLRRRDGLALIEAIGDASISFERPR
jgi:hypothetical protein